MQQLPPHLQEVTHTHTQKPLKLHFYISLSVTTETEFTFEARALRLNQSSSPAQPSLKSEGQRKSKRDERRTTASFSLLVSFRAALDEIFKEDVLS